MQLNRRHCFCRLIFTTRHRLFLTDQQEVNSESDSVGPKRQTHQNHLCVFVFVGGVCVSVCVTFLSLALRPRSRDA